MRKGLIALSLLVANNVYADTCIPKPDCADMGYTETSCNGGALKCPFDTTKLFCTASLPPAVECDVGMIYYSNGKCYSDYNTSYGIALGVVVVGDSLVVSKPRDYMTWGGYGSDITNVPNVSNSGVAQGDMNGKSNTLAIVSEHSSSGENVSTSAAMYCNNYAPTGTNAGDWYLPAMGELYNYIYKNLRNLNSGMNAMGGNLSTALLSSTERDDEYAWSIYTDDGSMGGECPKNNGIFVSCFLDISGR